MKISIVFCSLLVAFIMISCNGENPDKQVPISFMRDGQHSGYNASEPITSLPVIKWKVKTGDAIVSSPASDGDQVFIGSNDNLMYALDAETGEVQWTFQTGGPIASSAALYIGLLFFLSYDGYFYALDKVTGKLSWKFQTGGESKFEVKDYYNGNFEPDFWDFYLSSPSIENDLVYFGSSDSFVYALNSLTGDLIWKYKTEGKVHSSPTVDGQNLVIGSWDSRVYCLEKNSGKENWVYETGRDTAQYIWLGIQASPSISGDTVYVGSRDAKFYAINLKSGDTIWTNNNFDLSWMPSTAAFDKDNLYTGSSDSFSFFSINKKTGKINYKTKTDAYTFSSPVIDDEMGYIGSANGFMFGIHLKSGEIKWKFRTDGVEGDSIRMFDQSGLMDIPRLREFAEGISNMPALSAFYLQAFKGSGSIVSSPVKSGNTLYFGSMDGNIYAITNAKLKN